MPEIEMSPGDNSADLRWLRDSLETAIGEAVRRGVSRQDVTIALMEVLTANETAQWEATKAAVSETIAKAVNKEILRIATDR